MQLYLFRKESISAAEEPAFQPYGVVVNRRDVSQKELLDMLQDFWHVPQEPACRLIDALHKEIETQQTKWNSCQAMGQ